jgi:S1-C subfamily serine protease
VVTSVAEDSPAGRAGVAQGDLIAAAAGRPVHTPDDLFDALQAESGGTIELTIICATDERTIQVTFGDPGQPDN